VPIDSYATEEEEENLKDTRAFSFTRQNIVVDELTDTAESSPSGQRDDDVDRVPFINAFPVASTIPLPKRTSGVFADEEEMMFDS
jgi:hypothetical protein